MGKPRKYGMFPDYTLNKRRDLRFIKKNQRNREKAPRTQVAGQNGQAPDRGGLRNEE